MESNCKKSRFSVNRAWLLMVIFAVLATGCTAGAKWKPYRAPLETKWAKNVTPDNALSEYPRPQMVRRDWQNLNGLWDYAIRPKDDAQLGSPDGRILVPFCAESALSGVMEQVGKKNSIWYKRTFDVPRKWGRGRILLHFGAVDWETKVWVNGMEIGSHRGGFDPFSFDITYAIKNKGPQEIIISVWDPTCRGSQPHGKQSCTPGGGKYPAVSGIWQTVWLEPVPKAYIKSLKIVPEVDTDSVSVLAVCSEQAADYVVEAEVKSGWISKGTESRMAGEEIAIAIKKPKLWTPKSPFLYDLKVTLKDKRGKVVDSVDSYFGMRKISLGKDKGGLTRIMLNNEFVFQYGVLDPGYWPTGLYTAPTDEALRYDLEAAKKFGFNMIRKHLKVEPARWYYWCDKIGLLVWQDMPSGKNSCDKAQEQFEQELKAMVDNLGNHPSVAMWTIFSEGEGQYDTQRLAAWLKRYDKTRMVDAASGGVDWLVGDVHDDPSANNNYPFATPNHPDRASVIGRANRNSLVIEGHTWERGRKPRLGMTPQSANHSYMKYLRALWPSAVAGVSAAAYTQLTDIEDDLKGLLTYDRQVLKPYIKGVEDEIAPMKELISAPIPAFKTVVADSKYTLELPPIKPILDQQMRDPAICLAPDGTYYLTGTTWQGDDKATNKGIRLWKSQDLTNWQDMGYVWTFEKNAHGWEKKYRGGRRAVIAPEIHYIKGTFWIAFSLNTYNGCGLLKSTSGRPEGPYVSIDGGTRDGLSGEMHASLFEDDDGAVYWIFQNGRIARLKDDMSGLAEGLRILRPADRRTLGNEAAFLFKRNGKYYFVCSDYNKNDDGLTDYNCWMAIADNIYGPYSESWFAIQHGGGNMIFKAKDGQWYSTYTGHDRGAPLIERPALIPVKFDEQGRIWPKFPPEMQKQRAQLWKYIFTDPGPGWEKPDFDDSSWEQGYGAFGTDFSCRSPVRTEWDEFNIWMRRTFTLDSTEFGNLYISNYHDENANIWVNGQHVAGLYEKSREYFWLPVDRDKYGAFKTGVNTLAVHCDHTEYGQIIDIGFDDFLD